MFLRLRNEDKIEIRRSVIVVRISRAHLSWSLLLGLSRTESDIVQLVTVGSLSLHTAHSMDYLMAPYSSHVTRHLEADHTSLPLHPVSAVVSIIGCCIKRGETSFPV
jgi:hypothetical protein